DWQSTSVHPWLAIMIFFCCSKCANNLRNFFHSRPPLVIFLFNLIIFAAALLFLSYWIQYNDMQNPDATKDWNRFLERFASMEICLTGNKSYPFIRRLSAFTIDGDSAIDLPQPVAHAQPRLKLHRMLLGVELDDKQRHALSNYSILIGAISGRLLGLRDRSTAYQVINITAVIPQLPKKRDKICVEMVGPESIFPRTKPPRQCGSPSFDLSRRLLSSGDPTPSLRMSYMYIFKTVYWSSLFFCSSGQPRLKLKYSHNPRLTEMLSTEEKYVAEENLSHTAYAISVLIACFLIYAATFGSHSRNSGLSSAATGGTGGSPMYRSLSLSTDPDNESASLRVRNSLSLSAETSDVFLTQQQQQHHQEQKEQHDLLLMESMDARKINSA
ncbi:hypothetical protein BOX15_Mlig006171g1, partial [Macrostomum lignano]